MIQYYGRFENWWSHSQVSRGIVEGLWRNGWTEARIADVDDGKREGLTVPVKNGTERYASIGFYIGGYPPFAPRLDTHRIKVALFIAESAAIPTYWATLASRFDLVCVPSQWTFDAYAAAGVPADRMMVVRHGLHPVYCYRGAPRAQKPPRGPLHFLHVAGAASFLHRKGTPQLLEALKAFDPGEVKLYLRTPDTAYVRELIADVPHVDLDVRMTGTPPQMLDLYTTGWHALIAPATAEAFGMVPLEARAVGLPVICTHCSGHAEHAHLTDTVIEHGPDVTTRVNGIPNAVTPSVTAEAIEDGIRRFLAAPLRRAPLNYYQDWTWQHVTRGLARRLAQL